MSQLEVGLLLSSLTFSLSLLSDEAQQGDGVVVMEEKAEGRKEEVRQEEER